MCWAEFLGQFVEPSPTTHLNPTPNPPGIPIGTRTPLRNYSRYKLTLSFCPKLGGWLFGHFLLSLIGHAPVRLGLSGGNSGKIPERPRKRSQSFSWNFPSRVQFGPPKPYNSRSLKLPEHFQNSLPLSTAGDASFSRT